MEIVVVVNHSLTLTRTNTHTHIHSHEPVHLDVDECAKNNGGCDSKRKCTNTVGSMKCDDCPAGYTNDGAKGCKGFVCVCVCVCVYVCTYPHVGELMHGACSV